MRGPQLTAYYSSIILERGKLRWKYAGTAVKKVDDFLVEKKKIVVAFTRRNARYTQELDNASRVCGERYRQIIL